MAENEITKRDVYAGWAIILQDNGNAFVARPGIFKLFPTWNALLVSFMERNTTYKIKASTISYWLIIF